MDVHLTDFLTIGLLVLLEGLLSADNALVLAILVLGLPRADRGQIGSCAGLVVNLNLDFARARLFWSNHGNAASGKGTAPDIARRNAGG